jgi:hypothetical protein
MVGYMEINDWSIEEAHWRTGLSRACLRERGSVSPTTLDAPEAAALDLSRVVVAAFTL